MKDYDWGTNFNESFRDYFNRLEDQIDECIDNNQNYPIYIIMDILKGQVWNPNAKLADVYDLLKRMLKREPLVDDLRGLVGYIEDRLTNRTKRILNKPKQLNESNS